MSDPKNYLPPELAAQALETDARENWARKFIRPAACQCILCLRYLSQDRSPATGNHCVKCLPGGIPLADIRGPESLTPGETELLGLLTEEAGEVSQRVGKILRWGMSADFHGSSQTDKLETELGDVLAAIVTAAHNKMISTENVIAACKTKLGKLWEDFNGPRQRLGRVDAVNPKMVAFVVEIVDE